MPCLVSQNLGISISIHLPSLALTSSDRSRLPASPSCCHGHACAISGPQRPACNKLGQARLAVFDTSNSSVPSVASSGTCPVPGVQHVHVHVVYSQGHVMSCHVTSCRSPPNLAVLHAYPSTICPSRCSAISSPPPICGLFGHCQEPSICIQSIFIALAYVVCSRSPHHASPWSLYAPYLTCRLRRF